MGQVLLCKSLFLLKPKLPLAGSCLLPVCVGFTLQMLVQLFSKALGTAEPGAEPWGTPLPYQEGS